MASDYFLEIDGIKGESSDSKHKGAIEVESFSWGVSNPSRGGSGGGGGTGKAIFQDIHFNKSVDISSPMLFLKCATGQHIKKAILFVRKAGADQQEYYQLVLEDVLISEYKSAGDEGENDGVPVDQFSINFAKIEFSYTPPPGAGDKVTATWDLKKNERS